MTCLFHDDEEKKRHYSFGRSHMNCDIKVCKKCYRVLVHEIHIGQHNTSSRWISEERFLGLKHPFNRSYAYLNGKPVELLKTGYMSDYCLVRILEDMENPTYSKPMPFDTTIPKGSVIELKASKHRLSLIPDKELIE